ncbi:MAG: dienelactone hydrolase family protein [Bordetella sp.]
MRKSLIALFWFLGVISPSGFAQWNIEAESKLFPPLNFENKPSKLGIFSNLKNNWFAPETAETPVPAVVLLHACAGITGKSQGDLKRWAEVLLANGYAVLIIDHLGPRNIQRNCGRGGRVPAGQLVKDVHEAVSFLSRQPIIKKNSIFTLGFSKGAMTGGMVASQSSYRAVAPEGPRPKAVAGLYGGCDYGRGGNWLPEDADIPVLWLMGGADTESPPERCTTAIEAISKRGLMTSFTYPEATHCWDCSALDGFTKTAGNGKQVTYRYSTETTSDSEQRVLKFFNRLK